MIDPSRTSLSYDKMASKWDLPKTLMGGTSAMQQAGYRYLPKHPAETARVYQERAKRVVLRNYFRRTVQKLVGRVLSKPIVPSETVAPNIVSYLKNIDLMGQGLNTFAQTWFQDALISGISYVLVDFPVLKGEASLARQSQKSQRPYAVHIPAENLIAAQWETIEGNHRLSQIRVRETVVVYDGFDEVEVPQIRVMTPQIWETYRADNQGKWHLIDQGKNSLGEIPLVTLYTNRTGFMEASPPLEDLAYLNLEHYQIRSDQRNALNVASFPILAASGYDPEIDGPIEVGPNKVLTTSDTDGKYYYVESTGAALEAGSRELADLEKSIQLFGLQFDPGAVAETATARRLDAADAAAPLSAMVMGLEDSLNSLLLLFHKWMGTPHTGSLTVQAALDRGANGTEEINQLLSLQKAGMIDKELLLREMTARGVLQDSLAFNAASD